MERNPLIAPQVPSNDEAQVHALTEDFYSRVGNEPGSGGGKGWDPHDLPVRCTARGKGRPRPPADRQPPRTYNSIIHSPSSNEVQFSSVRMRTLLRRPWAQGTVQSNRTRAARGTRRRPNSAMSAARTSLRARARSSSPLQLHFRSGCRSAFAHRSLRGAPARPAVQCACSGPGLGGRWREEREGRDVRPSRCSGLKR